MPDSLDTYADKKVLKAAVEVHEMEGTFTFQEWEKNGFTIYLANPFRRARYKDSNVIIVTNSEYNDLLVYNNDM